MNRHFRAFSFVDRIDCLDAGGSIRGTYTIPASVREFPASLVAEATGQLAAWGAMSRVDFTHRPVAGIAGEINLLADVQPGQVLELTVELESVDTETVAYAGTAHVNGQPILRLYDCVGPMLPVADFDDPDLIRRRFALLTSSGAVPGGFAGLPDMLPEIADGRPGESLHAFLNVPSTADFFADHFPRRPVFPGTLLMHANLQAAGMLAAHVPLPDSTKWRPAIISEVKLRTFTSPGEQLDLTATWAEQSGGTLIVDVESRNRQRLVAGARIHLTAEKPA
jgi:3-hydroxymyristoyl/3-hydroxydecanoyl-(acyl carrier protein) dehydratase